MRLLYILTAIALICSVHIGQSRAQTPQMPEYEGVSVTFTLGDVLNAMTPSERTEFQELRLKMKRNMASQKQIADDPDSVAALESRLTALKEEFESKFGFLRGIKDETVTVYGSPLPSKQEIMDRLVYGRTAGGDPTLYPHWYRTGLGEMIGSNTRPEHESGPPAGETHELFIPGESLPIPVEQSDRDTSCEAQAGPRPTDRNYELRCKCTDGAFGIDSCWWVRD